MQNMEAPPTLLTGLPTKALQESMSWHESEMGMHMNQVVHIFHECDRDHNGSLTWSTGEVHNFLQRVCRDHGLNPPSNSVAVGLLKKIGCDAKLSIDERDCVRLVRELFSKGTCHASTIPGEKIIRTHAEN